MAEGKKKTAEGVQIFGGRGLRGIGEEVEEERAGIGRGWEEEEDGGRRG